MKTSAKIAVIILAGLVSAVPAVSQDKGGLIKKQNSINSEYSLAKDPAFYFVLDILGRKLELRVRGLVLRSWTFKSMRFWGRPELTGNVELIRKTALKAPERIVIKPGGGAEKVEAAPAAAVKATGTNPVEFELEALEIKDMPKKFGLDFDNGLHIVIKAKKGASGGLPESMREGWRWYVDLPLRNLFGPPGRASLSEFELTFENDKDAQSIYWHFFDGIKGIIL